MADGVGGVLVRSAEECGRALVALLKDPERARDLAHRGRERVYEHFLMPRLLLNELQLIQELAAGRPVVPLEHRDPVCGMSVSAEEPAPEAQFEGTTYRFCSGGCRNQFMRDPAHYVGGNKRPG
jgi:trehalose synthase